MPTALLIHSSCVLASVMNFAYYPGLGILLECFLSLVKLLCDLRTQCHSFFSQRPGA
jgi:hypothetical protein